MERVGRSKEAILSAPVSLCIDHHVTEGEFGQIRIVDSKSSSTGELMFDLLKALEVPISANIANCLMCAVITDTAGKSSAHSYTSELAIILIS